MFLFNKTVKIINRGTYTSGKRAASYCGRLLAEFVSAGEIRMLEAAELALLKQQMKSSYREYDPVTGKFTWLVADSGGSSLMKQYTGISGGTRVLQASHGN